MFQSLLSSSYPAPRLSYPTNKSLGKHKKLGGSTATTADLRGIPAIWHHPQYIKQREKEKGGDIQRNGVAFPTHTTCDGAQRKW